MGRPVKTGISYFSMDVDFYNDPKIRLLQSKFGVRGCWIWLLMVCQCYDECGYYFDFDDSDKLLLFAEDVCREDISLVKGVLHECGKRGLFDLETLTRYGKLTSKRIQDNFIQATRERRKHGTIIAIKKEYWLIEIPKSEKNLIIADVESFSREQLSKSREKLLNNAEKNAEKIEKNDDNFLSRDLLSKSREQLDKSREQLSKSRDLVHKRKEKKRKESVCVNNTLVNTKSEASDSDFEDTHTHKLNFFIQENHKSILEIPKQMTYDECEMLIKEFPKPLIRTALEQLDNKRKDNYTKVYPTLKLFCENVKKVNGQAVSPQIATAEPKKATYEIIPAEEIARLEKIKRKKQLAEYRGEEYIPEPEPEISDDDLVDFDDKSEFAESIIPQGVLLEALQGFVSNKTVQAVP